MKRFSISVLFAVMLLKVVPVFGVYELQFIGDGEVVVDLERVGMAIIVR